jgi:hypothetical protein
MPRLFYPLRRATMRSLRVHSLVLNDYFSVLLVPILSCINYHSRESQSRIGIVGAESFDLRLWTSAAAANCRRSAADYSGVQATDLPGD